MGDTLIFLYMLFLNEALQFNCMVLINADNKHNRPQDITILEWLKHCMCLPNPCTLHMHGPAKTQHLM